MTHDWLMRLLTSAPDHPEEWSYQGLGMLRLYLTKRLRLHVWCPSRAVKDVSAMHTHPWHLRSEIMAGSLTNTRYTTRQAFEYADEFLQHRRKPYVVQAYDEGTLHCGAGGGLLPDKPRHVQLVALPPEVYGPGEEYQQRFYERHITTAEEGTVTLIEREPATVNPDLAYVYWPTGEQWVSAEPRPATAEEISFFTSQALSRLLGLSVLT